MGISPEKNAANKNNTPILKVANQAQLDTTPTLPPRTTAQQISPFRSAEDHVQ
jgi:hypothetical protein